MSTRSPLRPKRTTAMSSGTVAILFGFVTYLLSKGRDGFDKGLFSGMTVALMVIGAYLIGSTMWGGDHKDKDKKSTDSDDDLWLPSRDDH